MKLTDRQARQIASGLADLTKKLLTGSISRKTAAQRLRAAAKWLEEGEQIELDLPGSGEAPTPRADVVEIFEHWKKATGRVRAKLDQTRSKLIRKRLDEGITIDELKRVISWAVQDPKCQGKWDWIENLLRKRDHMERCLESAENWRPIDRDDATARRIEELTAESRKAMNDDDHEKYEAIQRELRRIRGE